MKFYKAYFFIIAFFAISVGLYPITYFLFDMKGGLLGTKTEDLLSNTIWNIAFYIHISFGAFAMLTGWPQFSEKWRLQNINLHRNLGKIYLVSVLISGISGFYIALFATGGLVAVSGFVAMSLVWLFTSFTAYTKIRKLDINSHRNWMIRSYAITFSAVTLRLWLPVIQSMPGMDFIATYKIVAWISWVVNLLIAEWIIKKTSMYSNYRIPNSTALNEFQSR
jgi:uncharacterized membrane protein